MSNLQINESLKLFDSKLSMHMRPCNLTHKISSRCEFKLILITSRVKGSETNVSADCNAAHDKLQ